MFQNKLAHHEPGRPGWQGMIKSKHGMSTSILICQPIRNKIWKKFQNFQKPVPEIVGSHPNTDKQQIMTGSFFNHININERLVAQLP